MVASPHARLEGTSFFAPLSAEEIERRRPVWQAMSDLFLDTEVRWDVPFVARACAECGYDDATLERIFWAEVFPEAIGNLRSVIGEWCLLELDEAALIRRAGTSQKSRFLRRLFGADMVESEWQGVSAITQWLRPLDEFQRARLVKTLHLCGRYYFETPGDWPCSIFEDDICAARDTLAETWTRYEPLCRSMLLKSEARIHDARAAAVLKLLSHQAPTAYKISP
jgi:hypothetical protein